MTFVYEKLTEQDWERYPSLDLQGLTGWYIDKHRDASIWMTTGLNISHPMVYAEHLNKDIANLRVGERLIEFDMKKGQGSLNLSERPYLIVWDAINSCSPNNLHELGQEAVYSLLKDGLTAFGGGIFKNTEIHPDFAVEFNF